MHVQHKAGRTAVASDHVDDVPARGILGSRRASPLALASSPLQYSIDEGK